MSITGGSAPARPCDPTNPLVSGCLAIQGGSQRALCQTNTHTREQATAEDSREGKGGVDMWKDRAKGAVSHSSLLLPVVLLAVGKKRSENGGMTDAPGRKFAVAPLENSHPAPMLVTETPCCLNLTALR